MTTRPRQKSTAKSRSGSARSAAGTKITARKRESKVMRKRVGNVTRKRRSPAERRTDAAAMRAAFAAVARPRRPLADWVTCATPPVATSGKVEFDNAYTMSTPDLVAMICHGSGFGTGVPVTWTKTATGWSFGGSRPFCHVQKCSDGTASTDTVTVSGKIASDGSIEFAYVVRAYCGTAFVCIEVGNYAGSKIGSPANLLEADYRGTTTWTLTCCPEPTWAYSAFPPPPPLPVGGVYIEPPRSSPKRKGR